MHLSTSGPERIGSYRLVKLLGQGKTCEIWDVERGADGQRLAMKLLWPGRHHTRELIGQLKHEYAVGRALDHPNVIRTLEFVSTPEGTYLIMELFRAPNLKQWIQQGVERIAYLAEDIIHAAAEGLRYVHDAGWVHRDVKPDNYLVSDAGQVKLIDFNLARKRRGGLARMFAGSKVQGTQSYMSPEQIRGKHVDERSDLYSLGCVVHELISGKPPFTGITTQELLGKHLKARPPSLLPVAPNVHPSFARLVQQMLAKTPQERPASMAAFLDELAELTVFRTRPEPPADRGAPQDAS